MGLKPRIIIHGIQKKIIRFIRRVCKLKLKIMIVGYDTEFNHILSDISVELRKFENGYLENGYHRRRRIHEKLEFRSIKLEHGHKLIKNHVPFFGIPVLENF